MWSYPAFGKMEYNANFLKFWTSRFGNCPPVGYIMKSQYPQHHIRIHSLSSGKRYPENDGDWKEASFRMNSIINYITKNEHTTFLMASYGTDSDLFDSYPDLQGLISEPDFFLSYNVIGTVLDSDMWRFYCCGGLWGTKESDKILRLISHDELRNFSVLSKLTGSVCCFYDGGADVIFSESNFMNTFCSYFHTWIVS